MSAEILEIDEIKKQRVINRKNYDNDINLMKFVNTVEFSKEAQYFTKFKKYTNAPRGSREYKEYWAEQKRRCREGYSVGGTRITGEHYGYLNFGQIRRLEDKKNVELGNAKGENFSKSRSAAYSKEFSFPDFWDGDYLYFHAREIARHGGIYKGRLYKGGQHLCVAKKRRGGYSYKNGYVAAHRYKNYPRSVTILAAYDSSYLYPEGTMQMAYQYVDLLNEHTIWRRKKLKDSENFIKDGRSETRGGIEIEKGYRSQIIAVSFGKNAGIARGKDGDLVFVEEAGKAPNLIDFVNSTLPTLREGAVITGMMIIFGTGGGNNINWEGFQEIFYDPENYDMMSFENEWDEGMTGTFCGFFVPQYMNMPNDIDNGIILIDANGNSNIEAAKAFEMEIREKKKKSKDGTALNDYCMEYPFTPSEAFQIKGTNIFPVQELKEHRAWLLASGEYKKNADVGRLVRDKDGVLEFRLDSSLSPVYEYPPKKAKDLTGAIVKYHVPYRVNGLIPDDLYMVCVDTYRHDKTTGNSVGAVYVIMNSNNIIPELGDTIVASYIARPDLQDDFNKVVYELAEYYNAKIGYENDEPGELVGYGKRFKLLDYLHPEFELAFDDRLKKNAILGRGFGIHMGAGKDNKIKMQGDKYIQEWLLHPRGEVAETDKKILNLHKIRDIGLLEELIKYRLDGNFDRVSALRVAMYQSREMIYNDHQAKIPEPTKSNSYWKRPKFVNTRGNATRKSEYDKFAPTMNSRAKMN